MSKSYVTKSQTTKSQKKTTKSQKIRQNPWRQNPYISFVIPWELCVWGMSKAKKLTCALISYDHTNALRALATQSRSTLAAFGYTSAFGAIRRLSFFGWVFVVWDFVVFSCRLSFFGGWDFVVFSGILSWGILSSGIMSSGILSTGKTVSGISSSGIMSASLLQLILCG